MVVGEFSPRLPMHTLQQGGQYGNVFMTFPIAVFVDLSYGQLRHDHEGRARPTALQVAQDSVLRIELSRRHNPLTANIKPNPTE